MCLLFNNTPVASCIYIWLLSSRFLSKKALSPSHMTTRYYRSVLDVLGFIVVVKEYVKIYVYSMIPCETLHLFPFAAVNSLKKIPKKQKLSGSEARYENLLGWPLSRPLGFTMIEGSNSRWLPLSGSTNRRSRCYSSRRRTCDWRWYTALVTLGSARSYRRGKNLQNITLGNLNG